MSDLGQFLESWVPRGVVIGNLRIDEAGRCAGEHQDADGDHTDVSLCQPSGL
jgi:hypothetical protein